MQTLNVRPGLTGAGQIFYTQLQQAPAVGAEDPEQHYITYELHAKLGFDLDYLRRRSLRYDLTIVLRTVLLVTGLGKRIPSRRPGPPRRDGPGAWPAGDTAARDQGP